ncbi:hypothetical protein EST38_g1508 [Candolleomyces aberdarensis]|uniref:Tc1-like transposase DDE domain-containing protein n=1 Tax=Candolleomyces aberdarensis TaxID=2316362 RepID=A0A4Q2DWW2_9AGAR|nr:hypothetical protein EST38_g1508 [Candolleomyces aberdarensis]
MGKKKRAVNARSLANLKGQVTVPDHELASKRDAESDLEEFEDFDPNVHLDSAKPIWSAETDEEDSDELEILGEGEDAPVWSSEKLVREGIYGEMHEAAIGGWKSTYLGDGDDPNDEDWLDSASRKAKKRQEKEKKGPASTRYRGPDISQMSARTQTKYKKAWRTQTRLTNTFEPRSRERTLSRPSSVKAESDEELDVVLKSSQMHPEDDIDIPIRQETPEISLEFLDCEIREESATPPPLYFDDEISNFESTGLDGVELSDTAGSRKRRASVEIAEVEDEDAPGGSKSRQLADSGNPPLTSVDESIDPETGVECWEEELSETLLPTPEIRDWDTLRNQINTCLKTKFATYSPSQINQLIILRSFATLRLRGTKKMEASRQIALQWQEDVRGSAVHLSRRIRALAQHYQIYEELPTEKRGGYRSRSSLLRDEAVRAAARGWLTAQKIGTVSPKMFREGINKEIIPGLGIVLKAPLSTKTATRWLVKLGWIKVTRRKGVYMDGHEREDVVQYRKESYLPKMRAFQERMAKYVPVAGGKELRRVEPTLNEGEREIIAVFQDETCFHANEYQSTAWVQPGQQILQKKGRGRLIHDSDFICESTGRLVVYNSDGSIKREARKLIYPGANGQAWWNKDQLIEQVKDDAIPVFEEANPGKQALFIFDQSSAHAALPDDALKAFEMNKSNGGAQRTQQDTVIPMNNPDPRFRGQPQSMTVVGANGKRVPKGMQQVLEERGFDVRKLKAKCQPVCPIDNKNCCMARLLSQQEDFANQISELEMVIVDAGHLCLFLPKFHCELNPIEMYWGWAKYRYRQMEKRTFEDAKKAAIQCLDACPADVIRRFINRSWRFTAAYEQGLTGQAAAWAVRKYKGHRTISNQALIRIESLVN